MSKTEPKEYTEQIKFDPEIEEMFILRKIELGNGKFDYKHMPLSTWNLVKRIDCCLTCVRKFEQASV